jgi:hypothetical protein
MAVHRDGEPEPVARLAEAGKRRMPATVNRVRVEPVEPDAQFKVEVMLARKGVDLVQAQLVGTGRTQRPDRVLQGYGIPMERL